MADVSEKDRVLHQAAMLKHAQNEGALDPEFASIMLLQGAYYGDIPLVVTLLERGVPLDTADKVTGMTALHLAVGCNHLDVARTLVERGASFVPDKQGRMPTTIAAECEVSEELCDFIVEAEAEARAKGV